MDEDERIEGRGHCPHGQGAGGAVGYLKESVEDRTVKNLLIANLRSQGNMVYDCTDDTNCTARQNLLNAKGYALADEWIYYKDKWYYLKKDCRMAVGWQQVDGYWYYLGSDGVMLDGWQQIKGKWYYLDQEGEERPHGAMVTGEMKDGNHTYYLQDNGAMLKEWIKRKGRR